jgi:hypothetical protein
MNARIFFRAGALLVILLTLGACDGDSAKTTSSCATDDDCAAGICHDTTCYQICSESAACEAQELCATRTSDQGREVAICVAASAFAGCAGPDDCAAVVPGPCGAVACDADASLCVVRPLEDGLPCTDAQGASAECAAGACGGGGEGEGCAAGATRPEDCPAGTWAITFTRAVEGEGACVVDGQVTQTLTLVLAWGEAGQLTVSSTSTNNYDPYEGTCFEYTSEIEDVSYDATTGAFEMVQHAELQCPGQEERAPMTYGYSGTVDACCARIVGEGWTDPENPCEPDSRRTAEPMTYERVDARD